MKIIDITKEIPETNFSAKITNKIGIVFHLTDDTCYDQAANWCKNPKAKVSYNYVFERNGDVKILVKDENVAYHAGRVNTPTSETILEHRYINPNDYMIGFGVVGKPGMRLTLLQRQSLVWFTELTCKKNNIAINRYNLIGHNEVNSIDKIYCPVTLYSVDSLIMEIDKKSLKDDNIAVSSENDRLRVEIENLKSRLANEEGQVIRYKRSRAFWFNKYKEIEEVTSE